MRDSIGTKVPRSWILLACIGLIALNMRGPFVAVAPVLGPMQQELGFTSVELGLLTGIPVLCFSLAAPLASLAGRRLGAELAITLTLAGVLAGVAVRSAGGGAMVMAGTVILGLAITVGNIAVPLIIRRDFSPRRQGTAMGIYTAALNVGSFVTSVVTAPLAEWPAGGRPLQDRRPSPSRPSDSGSSRPGAGPSSQQPTTVRAARRRPDARRRAGSRWV